MTIVTANDVVNMVRKRNDVHPNTPVIFRRVDLDLETWEDEVTDLEPLEWRELIQNHNLELGHIEKHRNTVFDNGADNFMLIAYFAGDEPFILDNC